MSIYETALTASDWSRDPDDDTDIEKGIALCLSGGGYRAMVFHLGALWRLNEAGLLQKLNRISSVSGGSITSATLALHWGKLDFDDKGIAQNFGRVVDAVRSLADVTIDIGAVVRGLFLPGSAGDNIAKAYDQHLFGGASLQDLPQEVEGVSPRFVINASNVQSGVLWRFSPKYMADYRVGMLDLPDIKVSKAVAASSAFPPFLSPMRFHLDQPMQPRKGNDLHRKPFTTEPVLTDGGVYDNLGLETAFDRYRTLLVSDGGKALKPEARPFRNWLLHAIRVLFMINNQVGSLRRRHLIEAFLRKRKHDGTYWGIDTVFEHYDLEEDPLGCAKRDPTPLAKTSTRLAAMDDVLQEKLINWGYAITDAALRRWFDKKLQKQYDVTIALPKGFPYKRGY